MTEQPDLSVRRVLIYRLGSLGDTVVALPCFNLIARIFPNAERRLLTNFSVHSKAPASAAVLGESGLIHSYMRYAVKTRNVFKLLHLALEIRRFKPDVFIYLMPARLPKDVSRDKFFFRLAGIKRWAGLLGPEEIKHRFDALTGRFESEAARLARSLQMIGNAHPEVLSSWDLKLTEAERERAAQVLAPTLTQVQSGPLVVCGPGTKMQAKDWGQENWRALLTRIEEQYPGASLALIGAGEELEIGEFVAANWQGARVNLCGQLTPRETAAVLTHAQLFLGPDSGPMHLAASVGIPAVIAFSARGLPGIWFPAGTQHQVIYHQTSCYGCNLEHCTTEARRCLTGISVEEIFTAVETILSNQTSRNDQSL